jgi:DNA-binding NarL/FixJ family response regulator
MAALLGEAGLDVIGEAATWAEAERLAPGVDAILVDLWMPDVDIDALARVRECAPHATLAVVTALGLAEATERVATVAIDLLLPKTAPPADIAAAIARHAVDGAGAPL